MAELYFFAIILIFVSLQTLRQNKASNKQLNFLQGIYRSLHQRGGARAAVVLPDNVLFEDGVVSGVFDFYHACDATFLFDLAVVANDWTTDAKGLHDTVRLEHLCEGYQSERVWTDKEKAMWPYCLELAALRFWISRLMTRYLPSYQQDSVAGDVVKNPDEMKAILVGLAAWDDDVAVQ